MRCQIPMDDPGVENANQKQVGSRENLLFFFQRLRRGQARTEELKRSSESPVSDEQIQKYVHRNGQL
jgi:hypothetical protein